MAKSKILNPSITLSLTVLFLLTGCGPRLYTRKELRVQNIRIALKDKTWTLKEILIGDSALKESYHSYQADPCPFSFQFADKGELIMNFKSNKFHGTYLIEEDKFKYLHCGWNMKVVWTG